MADSDGFDVSVAQSRNEMAVMSHDTNELVGLPLGGRIT